MSSEKENGALLYHIREEVGVCLNYIHGMFKADAKLTLLVRIPGNDNAELVFSNDDLPSAVEALSRRIQAAGIQPNSNMGSSQIDRTGG